MFAAFVAILRICLPSNAGPVGQVVAWDRKGPSPGATDLGPVFGDGDDLVGR